MMSILLVDDDAGLLDLIRRFLEKEEDMEIEASLSATDALDKLLAKKYDAIVLDYELPGMDGIEFLRQMKARRDETPIIIFTGKGREEVVIESLKFGAAFYLKKGGDPRMNFQELFSMIREAVQKHKKGLELRKSEQRFREALEHLTLVAFQTDIEGNILYCNDFFLDLFGREREEVIGANWFDLFLPQGKKNSIKKLFSRLIEGAEEGRHFSCPVQNREGELRQIELNNTILRDSEGNGIGVSSIGEDITERLLAEEVQRNSEERLKILFEYAPDAYFLIDLSGNFVDCNRAAEDLFGYSKKELMAKNFYKSGIIAQRDMPRGISLLARHVDGEPTGPEELIIIRQDGRELVTEMRHFPLMFGKKHLVLGSAHDVTDRKMDENSLRRVNAKLNLLNSITRHDILNTLTALLLYIELLKEDPKDDAQKEIFSKVEILTQTIKKQLEFTRVYQDIGIQSPQWQSLTDIARRVEISTDLGGVHITSDLEEMEIYADPLLENVFHNLVDNTLRHGEDATTIWLTSYRDESGLKLIYEDNGKGIPSNEKEVIFKRGYGKNTGFGLFLSREILAITGMTIKETGIFGKGVRFEINVPLGNFRLLSAKGAGKA